jgi:hypothetical protein
MTEQEHITQTENEIDETIALALSRSGALAIDRMAECIAARVLEFLKQDQNKGNKHGNTETNR